MSLLEWERGGAAVAGNVLLHMLKSDERRDEGCRTTAYELIGRLDPSKRQREGPMSERCAAPDSVRHLALTYRRVRQVVRREGRRDRWEGASMGTSGRASGIGREANQGAQASSRTFAKLPRPAAVSEQAAVIITTITSHLLGRPRRAQGSRAPTRDDGVGSSAHLASRRRRG